MKRSCLMLMMVLGGGSMAHAQAPGQAEPATAPFLEKRIPDELASEGLVLSRRNLALQVEQLGDRWLVSLVDLTTHRVAASTKVDTLPADREAAVAAMTHVVAELAEQITGPREPAPAAPPPAAPAPDDRAQREVAELKYQRQAIRFSKLVLVNGEGGMVVNSGDSRHWSTYQGELDQQMAPAAFYQAVGRPELTEVYESRRQKMYISFGVGSAAILGGFAWGWSQGLTDNHALPLMVTGVGFAASVLGIHYAQTPHGITENEAKTLADAYNQKLRRELGLPVVSQAPRLRDVKITPYLGEHDGGLVIAARF